MHCFRHSPTEAIGLCKTCFKAVCRDCAVDVGNGLACAGDCEQKVLELNEMWERSARIYGVGRYKSRIPSTGVLLWLVLALGMWASTGYSYFRSGSLDVTSLVTAIVFTCGLGLAYYSARRTGLKC
jgi:hypothetical protein